MSTLWTSVKDCEIEPRGLPPVPPRRPTLEAGDAAILELGVLVLLCGPRLSAREFLGGVWAVAGRSDGCLLLLPRPNQPGKPCLRLKPPGGSRSSSVALTVPPSCISVVYMYVVRGVMSGWKMSVEKVTRGGRAG